MDSQDGIFTALRNLKNIPCPAGDSCSISNCAFKHPRESALALPRSESSTRGESAHADGREPRKRQRLDEAGIDYIKSHPELNTALEINSATKSVSPPPLKRKVPGNFTQTSVKHPESTTFTRPSSSSLSNTIGTDNHTPTSKSSSVNLSPAPQRTPTKAPRKPEPLNPRHLQKSPATHEFRYKALRMLHEQLVRLNAELKKDANDQEEKLVLSEQELVWLALDMEEHAAVDKPTIYNNVIKNRITNYKRMTVANWRDERVAEQKKEAAALIQTPKGPLLGPPRVVDTGLTPAQEVMFLQRLKTPIEKLAAHKYVPFVPTQDAIEKARQGEADSKGWEVCDRCGSRFQVFPGRREEDGALTSGGQCTYHGGRKYRPERSAIDIKSGTRHDEKWLCCHGEVGTSRGCMQASTHVFKTTDPARLSLVMPYMETPTNTSAPTDRAVCFDCEMCYTVRGFELIRLTATSWPDGAVILDVLVQPVGQILDFNSRYSGVFPDDFASAPVYTPDITSTAFETGTLKEGEVSEHAEVLPLKPPPVSPLHKVSSPVVARSLLFSLISPETPLIGHAIENDLGAARIIHPTVIDTVLLFPHNRGLPMRYGLKALMRQHLNKDVQVETAEQRGHDSAEDARAAGELVRLRVMTEWQRLQKIGWAVVGMRFLKPGEKGDLAEEIIQQSD